MKKTKKRLVGLTLTMLILIGSLASSVMAADNVQNLKGFFSNVISIFSNGQEINLGKDPVSGELYKPLVINERTYLPVRAISEALGKEISWTQATNRIDIVDKPDSNYNYVLQQLVEKQEEIVKLENKVKELEKALEESKKSSVSTLRDLEKLLNDRHGKYRDVRFDIGLTGTTKNMTVRVSVNRSDNSYWTRLTDSNIKAYIEDLVKEIQYEFKDAKIDGYIRNEYSNKDEKSFYINTRGNLVIENSRDSGGNVGRGDIKDLEYYLNSTYRAKGNVNFTINLSWVQNDIRATITVDQHDWNYLNTWEQREFLEDVCQEINYDFQDARIGGYLYDGSKNYSFTYDYYYGLEF